MRWPSRLPRSDPDRDPGASMALLEEVLDPPVGPGYHSAAQDRLAAGLPASSGTRTWLMLLTSILLGLLGTVAAMTLRTPDPAAAEGRAEIVARIEAAQAAGDERRQQVEDLRAEIAALEQQALEQAGSSTDEVAATAIAEAGHLAGSQAVSGPGVVLLLDDADQPADAAPGEQTEPERITARDVQLVVNGLWSAGAEAVSVNGHRLTSTSAIRFAGKAIIVDFRGLTPPYEIRAIGDPDALLREVSTGLSGAYLAELRTQLGLQAEVAASSEVTVGAGERLTTRLGSVAPVIHDDAVTPGEPGSGATPSAKEDER